jgi:hypothetical protein
LERKSHARPQLAKRRRCFDAAEPRHLDSEQGDRRLVLQSELDRLGAVDGFEDHHPADSLAGA